MANCDASESQWACWITDHANVLNNIANNLVPVEHLITGAAYLMGLGFAFKAISSLKQHGEHRSAMSSQSQGLKEPFVYFLVAAVFIFFPTALAVLLDTTFGYSSILAYSGVDSQNQTLNTLFGQGSETGRSLTIIIRVIGLIAFIRGWILISRGASHGQQPGGTGKGIMHIVGGILAMNIVGTLEVLNNTLFGTN